MKSKTISNHETKRKRWRDYAMVLGGVGLATIIRFPIQPAIHFVSPFLFYFPVVLVAALAFGRRFGLLATSLSVLPANYFCMFPDNAFEFNLDDFCQISSFLVAGVSVSCLGELARKRKVLEEHVRSTLASFGEAIVTLDCAGRIICFNTMAEMLTETSREQVVGRELESACDLFSADGEELNGAVRSALSQDDFEPLPKNVILFSKSGRQHQMEQRVSRILDAKGRRVGTALLLMRSPPIANPARAASGKRFENPLNADSSAPRIAIILADQLVTIRSPQVADLSGTPITRLLEWSNTLAQLGYEVDIWTRQFPGQDLIDPVGARVRVMRVPGGWGRAAANKPPVEELLAWCKMAAHLIRNHRLKYEFIHSHYWAGGFAGARLSEILNVPHIHTPHASEIDEGQRIAGTSTGADLRPRALDQPAGRVFPEDLAYASASVVLAAGPTERDLLVRTGGIPAEKCLVIRPGYDDTRFFPVGADSRQLIRKRLGFESCVILAVERLANLEACEFLLRTFGLVAPEVPQTVLHLAVGSKSLTPKEEKAFFRLRALAGELNLSERVRFAEFIPDPELADYCRAADVFLLASADESLVATAIRAMACGVPTVRAHRGVLPDSNSFGPESRPANPDDPAALGILIVKTLKDPCVRAQLSRLGVEQMLRSFTWTGVARQFLTEAVPKLRSS